MYLSEAQQAIKVCLVANVVPALSGHGGIGKTDIIKQIGAQWEDPYTGKVGIPVIVLYCATQEITDLIGFPIKVWEESGNPVVEGIKEEGRIVTSWAPPCWWPKVSSEEEAEDKAILKKIKEDIKENKRPEVDEWLFWNRPKCIVFLDEAKRAQRDVLQALYPLVLTQQLHMQKLPRGSRIITADNFAGAYDVREPDEAFMSRFCHLEVEAHIKAWHSYAREAKVASKVQNFLMSNPEFLISVSKDLEDACVKYNPSPDPRSWGDMVNRVEKYGRFALRGAAPEAQNHAVKNVIVGIVGRQAAEHYWDFSDDTISFEDILNGKAELAKVLEKLPNDIERNKLKEKLQLEAYGILQKRKYNAKEAENLCVFFLQIGSKERVTAVLQNIFTLKNAGELDQKWIDRLLQTKEIIAQIEHLMKYKKV